MAEREQSHRHDMECRTVSAQIEDMRTEHAETRRAQWFALTVALCMIGVGGLLVYTGSPGYGTILSGATIAGVITAFLQGKKNNATPSKN